MIASGRGRAVFFKGVAPVGSPASRYESHTPEKIWTAQIVPDFFLEETKLSGLGRGWICEGPQEEVNIIKIYHVKFLKH